MGRLWAGEDAVAEVALLSCAAWMAEVRSALTVLEVEVRSGGGAWVAAAAAGAGAGEDVIHMGRLLIAGKRLGGPLEVVR